MRSFKGRAQSGRLAAVAMAGTVLVSGTAAIIAAAPSVALVAMAAADSPSSTSDQPISTLPGRLINASPEPAAAGVNLAKAGFLAGWAVLTCFGIVVLRRRFRGRATDDDFVPMTLLTYTFSR